PSGGLICSTEHHFRILRFCTSIAGIVGGTNKLGAGMDVVEQTAGGSLALPRRGATYQVVLVGLLSLNFGILFFDRNALNFLMPFVKPDLGLTNTQVGLTASALSFSWAIAA